MSASNVCGVKVYTAKSLETLKCHSNLKLGWYYVHKLRIIGSSVDNILYRSDIYLGGVIIASHINMRRGGKLCLQVAGFSPVRQ